MMCVIRTCAPAIVCALVGTNSLMPEPDHAAEDAGFRFIKLLLHRKTRRGNHCVPSWVEESNHVCFFLPFFSTRTDSQAMHPLKMRVAQSKKTPRLGN